MEHSFSGLRAVLIGWSVSGGSEVRVRRAVGDWAWRSQIEALYTPPGQLSVQTLVSLVRVLRVTVPSPFPFSRIERWRAYSHSPTPRELPPFQELESKRLHWTHACRIFTQPVAHRLGRRLKQMAPKSRRNDVLVQRAVLPPSGAPQGCVSDPMRYT